MEVTVPDTEGKYLYLYRQDYSWFLPDTYPSASVPAISLPNTIDNVDQENRNGFCWTPEQWDQLSAGYRTNGYITNLPASDYLLGRRRHWLINPFTGAPGTALSLQQDPSPNGTIAGQGIQIVTSPGGVGINWFHVP